MSYKIIRYVLFYLLVMVVISSCATITTLSMPSVESEAKGDTKIGPITTYDFHVEHVGGLILKIYETPICSIVQKHYIIKKKQTRGALPALVELPIFGLGLADFVIADILAQNTKKEMDMGYVPTGEFTVCGEKIPLKNAKILIQLPVTLMVETAFTDGSGNLNLAKILDTYNEKAINLFVVKKDKIYYLTTIYIYE